MMSNQWSEEAQQATREAIDDRSFGIRDGKVFLKHIDGQFSYVLDDDALRGAFVIHSPGGEQLAAFETVEAMLSAGWLLD